MNANEAIQAVLHRHDHDGIRLMQILRETQESLGWLSPATLSAIAAGIGRPRAQVEGTASFYRFFHTQPLGQYRVLWSNNITDRLLGSRDLMQAMCRQLWVERGRVSEDGLVSVDTTSCTGLCDQGPAVLVNYRAVRCMTAERVAQMVDLIRNRVPLNDWPADWFRIDDNIRRRDMLLANTLAPGQALAAAQARGPDATLAEIKSSLLRGRGGAGFPTGQKWETCRNAPGQTRFIICNADEGEPGTFKDRVLLASHADLVFDGMTVAAQVVGASKGYVYLRGEYRHLLEPLNSALARRREAGLLGKNILGTDCAFDIEVHLGAGAYICGEESALIESLEGRRGIPRNRPPFPVTHGFLGQPTVVDNVETLAAAALVATHGGDWFRGFGTQQSTGTKLLSVAGDCARPGIYEYPYGVTVRQVLEDCGADHTQAVQVSGPSGTCIGTGEFDRRIAFEDLPTAGAFTVFDARRDLFEVARNYNHFFAHESCGFCTPCRVGTALLRKLMDKIAAGHGTRGDIDEIERLIHVMQLSAHCGLGRTAGNPLADTLKKFRPVWERHLKSLEFAPAFNLDAALAQARQMTGRDDAEAHLVP
ncbi:MAG: NAD(P)H-dependent oxidoreductase subunit E [Rhodocyclaceae bacterium]|nr:NAD(P)H-dependent oxidoreductase subunit E [Rhodocyclaceae bacterium]